MKRKTLDPEKGGVVPVQRKDVQKRLEEAMVEELEELARQHPDRRKSDPNGGRKEP